MNAGNFANAFTISLFWSLGKNDRIYSKKRTEITVIRIFKSFCSVFFMLLCLFFFGGGGCWIYYFTNARNFAKAYTISPSQTFVKLIERNPKITWNKVLKPPVFCPISKYFLHSQTIEKMTILFSKNNLLKYSIHCVLFFVSLYFCVERGVVRAVNNKIIAWKNCNKYI